LSVVCAVFSQVTVVDPTRSQVDQSTSHQTSDGTTIPSSTPLVADQSTPNTLTGATTQEASVAHHPDLHHVRSHHAHDANLAHQQHTTHQLSQHEAELYRKFQLKKEEDKLAYELALEQATFDQQSEVTPAAFHEAQKKVSSVQLTPDEHVLYQKFVNYKEQAKKNEVSLKTQEDTTTTETSDKSVTDSTDSQTEAKETKQGKQGKNAKQEAKQGKEGKKAKPGKEGKQAKPGKEGKQAKPGKEGKEGKQAKQGKEGKKNKEGKAKKTKGKGKGKKAKGKGKKGGKK